MIHTKKLTAAALAAILALSLCIPAFADGITTYSDKSVAFIESFEGYMQYQYEDPVGSGNYYIGYGTNCAKDAYPDGVTKAEAEQMLRDYLDKSVVPELNSFLSANSVSLTQQQYDALAIFTYNLGGSWMSGSSRFCTYIRNGLSKYTDEQIVDAMGVFGHQGTTPVPGLIGRRIREAQVLLYGDYDGANCPQYSWLIADRAGGELENDIFCYETGSAYGTLPEPTLEGKYFAGWYVQETGAMLKATDTVNRNLHIKATWSDKLVLPYSDVAQDAWYYDAVCYCYTQKLMSGTSSSVFSPAANMTRAMLVTVLWRMAGQPVVNYDMTFKDVPVGQWYTEAIRWAASEGIVSGSSAQTFGTMKDVTREQMVSILYRFANMQGKNVDVDEAQGLSAYSDGSKTAEYAVVPFIWASQMGIVSGYTAADGTKTINPKGTATRAQVAQIIRGYGMI